MFPTYQAQYQPYMYTTPNQNICTSIPHLDPSFMYQNNYPYYFQNFQTQNNTINEFVQAPPVQIPERALPAPRPQEAVTRVKKPSAPTQPKPVDSLSKTEQLRRKLANRPTTYLTERKHYLAQTLAPEDDTGRKLRPRNKKKKIHSHFRTQDKKEYASFVNITPQGLDQVDSKCKNEVQINCV